MSLVCANAINENYAVIGVDLPIGKGKKIIDDFNNGVFPLVAEDPKIDEFYTKTKEKGNFFATSNEQAYCYGDIIIVDVNLDVDKVNDSKGILNNYNVDLSNFIRAIETIGNNCKEDALILIETTVPPGTCKKIVNRIIKKCLKQRNLDINKIKIGHSYERVMPGPNYIDSIQSFYRVYSGIDKDSADAVHSFLETIIRTDEYPLTRLKDTNATETAKVLENSFRAMNISFIVEWSRFAEEAGINLYEVIDAIRLRPTHSNMMYPGIGVGGYCLTKDALLASWSRQNLIGNNTPLSLSENAINVNDQMPKFAFNFLKTNFSDLSNLSVVIMGVSYRGDIGDTRYSPVGNFYNYLKNEVSEIFCYDPYVDYWNEKSLKIEKNLNLIKTNQPDIIIISTSHTDYKSKKTIDILFSLAPTFIFDSVGLLSDSQIDLLSKKHIIKVLGRGDL